MGVAGENLAAAGLGSLHEIVGASVWRKVDLGLKDDIKVMHDLVRAGQLLKIEITDHIIIGGQTYRSLRELGCLC